MKRRKRCQPWRIEESVRTKHGSRRTPVLAVYPVTRPSPGSFAGWSLRTLSQAMATLTGVRGCACSPTVSVLRASGWLPVCSPSEAVSRWAESPCVPRSIAIGHRTFRLWQYWERLCLKAVDRQFFEVAVFVEGCWSTSDCFRLGVLPMDPEIRADVFWSHVRHTSGCVRPAQMREGFASRAYPT